MKYYVLFGPPGAGKGTQAKEIAARYKLCHISTGDLLRHEIAAGTPLGAEVKTLIDNGNLVPDEMVEAMIEAKFNAVKDMNGFLLDGFPRTLAQAEVLDRMLARRGDRLTACISLIIPDSLVHERIAHRAYLEGRADDARDEVVSQRIRTYHAKTEPLIAYYKAAGLYCEIDGTGTIEEVRERVFNEMDKH